MLYDFHWRDSTVYAFYMAPFCPLYRCAFLHFCSAKRPKLKQENPSLSVGSLAKQLSSAWKLMTPEQKKPYDLLAEKDKQRSATNPLCTYIIYLSISTHTPIIPVLVCLSYICLYHITNTLLYTSSSPLSLLYITHNSTNAH